MEFRANACGWSVLVAQFYRHNSTIFPKDSGCLAHGDKALDDSTYEHGQLWADSVFSAVRSTQHQGTEQSASGLTGRSDSFIPLGHNA